MSGNKISDSLETKLRIVKNDLEDNLNQYFGGGHNNTAVAPPRDFKVVKPRPDDYDTMQRQIPQNGHGQRGFNGGGGGSGGGFDDVEQNNAENRRKFVQQLGVLNNDVACSYARYPFDLSYFRQWQLQMRIQRVKEIDIDERILHSIQGQIKAFMMQENVNEGESHRERGTRMNNNNNIGQQNDQRKQHQQFGQYNNDANGFNRYNNNNNNTNNMYQQYPNCNRQNLQFNNNDNNNNEYRNQFNNDQEYYSNYNNNCYSQSNDVQQYQQMNNNNNPYNLCNNVPRNQQRNNNNNHFNNNINEQFPQMGNNNNRYQQFNNDQQYPQMNNNNNNNISGNNHFNNNINDQYPQMMNNNNHNEYLQYINAMLQQQMNNNNSNNNNPYHQSINNQRYPPAEADPQQVPTDQQNWNGFWHYLTDFQSRLQQQSQQQQQQRQNTNNTKPTPSEGNSQRIPKFKGTKPPKSTPKPKKQHTKKKPNNDFFFDPTQTYRTANPSKLWPDFFKRFGRLEQWAASALSDSDPFVPKYLRFTPNPQWDDATVQLKAMQRYKEAQQVLQSRVLKSPCKLKSDRSIAVIKSALMLEDENLLKHLKGNGRKECTVLMRRIRDKGLESFYRKYIEIVDKKFTSVNARAKAAPKCADNKATMYLVKVTFRELRKISKEQIENCRTVQGNVEKSDPKDVGDGVAIAGGQVKVEDNSD